MDTTWTKIFILKLNKTTNFLNKLVFKILFKTKNSIPIIRVISNQTIVKIVLCANRTNNTSYNLRNTIINNNLWCLPKIFLTINNLNTRVDICRLINVVDNKTWWWKLTTTIVLSSTIAVNIMKSQTEKEVVLLTFKLKIQQWREGGRVYLLRKEE
jgi:hypothetical protein